VDSEPVRRQIEDGLAALKMKPDAELARKLADYLGLLERWNEAYNLTAVRRPEEMIPKHVMDSLSILPFIGTGRVLDVGTGAGLPGLVLAAASPGQGFVVLDSAGKKTRFVEHAARRLGLDNVEVVKSRVEEYEDPSGFETIVSRAFSSLRDFVAGAGHLLAARGRMVAMKGTMPEDELAGLPAGWKLLGAHRMDIPGLEGARHVIELGRAGPAP
jgi:16S rRNA (guanine527-N7)-methyltransferase